MKFTDLEKVLFYKLIMIAMSINLVVNCYMGLVTKKTHGADPVGGGSFDPVRNMLMTKENVVSPPPPPPPPPWNFLDPP